MSTSRPIVALLAIFVAATSAVPYSKYGRSCKDIGCRSDEVCVMAEDPCSISQRDLCGRYPTCQRSSSGGGESCTTKVCPTGQYCKTENGRPTCVNTTPALTYDSAGVSSVNGQRTPTNSQPSVPPSGEPTNYADNSHYSNSNPYSNANAPPSEEVNHHQPGYANSNNPGYPPYPVTNHNNNNNNGYPPYPSGNGNVNNNNNNGYPPYPSSNNNNNNNNGYPPYPTNNNNNNRPGGSVDQYGYPVYPPSRPDNSNNANNANGRYHNTYPQHNLPQHNPGYSNTYSNSIYRRNGASANCVSALVLLGCFVLSSLRFRIASA